MNRGKLPEGWATAPVSTVTTLIRGVTYKKEQALNYLQDDYLPIIRANNIQNGKFDTTDLVFVPKNLVKESQKISPEDIVIAMSSGSKSVVGKSAHQRLPFECSFGAFCGALRPEKFISPNYIAHFTKSSFYRNKISSLSAGANINNIKPASFDLINIPIPSLDEQKIIAEKLDTLLAQVDSTKARLEQIPQILKRFRQAVLAAAVSGTLTTALRNSHSLIGWHSTNLGALIVDSCNGLAKRQGLNGNEITILRLADFKDAQRIIGNERKIKLDSKEENKYSLENDDILVIRVNGSADLAGRFIEYKSNGDIEGFCDHFIRLRLDSNKIMSRFLTYIANEGEGRFYLRNSLSTSAGQNTINQTSIKGLSFLLPPLKEQAEIVRRVEQLFAYADTIEKQVNNALTRVNSLTQSILAKAFRGELTAQWRAENPDLISGKNSAAALLEKIKAERAVSGGKKTSRKKA
ncbi:TPA: restriction endonuclease subunit S [Salmonella enterica subsp. enterica serovar Potsdam]|nr:restriction endonuclease subunit S [Salmonella enterica subsp. enterica serovar Potsdam]EDT7255865.1 restriction endonuclease subunit S [Salmonella enterica subsp. enterica]EEL2792618.1 restriction endonuclease subunit S [Salmonella enterica]EDU9694040.1 restriction endonuclease subunit S [Salmonella enterica subsp. enterica]EEL5779856.1 restriction endonuclease subunit S [Salmonella enterica subsp. enterica serovar Potsdam]